MPEVLEFDPVDSIAAGAVGTPGRRTFYIQATKDGATLTVLVEKEQVALLAERLEELFSRVAGDHPEDPVEVEASLSMPASLKEPTVPLFRAALMGIGFDPERELVLLELHEEPGGGEDAGAAGAGEGSAGLHRGDGPSEGGEAPGLEGPPGRGGSEASGEAPDGGPSPGRGGGGTAPGEGGTAPGEGGEGHLARIFATRSQMRAMAARGAEAVAAGRPPCPLCRLPVDPDGHVCPATNGHPAR